MRHNPKVDLEGLDFEMVDKEMETDEAVAVEGVVPKAKGDDSRPVVGQDNPIV